MDGFHGLLAFGQLDDDGDFNFAGGNHVNVDAFFCERVEHFAGDTGVAFHAHANDGELGDFIGGDDFAETNFLFEAVDDLLSFEEIGFVHGEGEVGGGFAGAVADVLNDHVHVDGGIADGFEDAGGDAGFVGDGDQGDFGLVFIERDAADDDAFHTFGFFFHKCSGVFV